MRINLLLMSQPIMTKGHFLLAWQKSSVMTSSKMIRWTLENSDYRNPKDPSKTLGSSPEPLLVTIA